jgi:pyruvate kinase
MRELALRYGVIAEYMEPRATTDEFFHSGIGHLVQTGLLQNEDRIVVLAGSFGRFRGASFIEISSVSSLLHRSNLV